MRSSVVARNCNRERSAPRRAFTTEARLTVCHAPLSKGCVKVSEVPRLILSSSGIALLSYHVRAPEPPSVSEPPDENGLVIPNSASNVSVAGAPEFISVRVRADPSRLRKLNRQSNPASASSMASVACAASKREAASPRLCDKERLMASLSESVFEGAGTVAPKAMMPEKR